ncbi:MAG: hypothetical protein QGI18_10130 [Candidatus Marinimicrobia bacterium]|jgi:hypothetical protein|nr:hypothetical protein [Candidatus Neomarinimicrobiota bacterium]
MSHRKIEWLNNRRIIYRKDPVNDVPTISTKHYNYYENGTYEHYHLFSSKSKITTYKSLKWHLLVLKYLNDDLLDLEFASICHFLADKENGFVTFFIKDKLLHEMIKDVINQGGDPPINKKRKIIFKDYNLLSFEEKMKIVGQLIGRQKLSKEKIYSMMLEINDMGGKISIQYLADLLGCSIRTIHRNMTKELRKEKTLLNEKI